MIRFKIGSCRFQIHFWFAAVCTFLLLIHEASQRALLAMLIHETGHIMAMYFLKQMPKTVSFHAFGIDIEENGGGSYEKDAIISISGPALNLISIFFYPIAPRFAVLSLLLGVFHLLPVFYLDGGRALYSFLCRKKEKTTAEKIVSVISVLTLLPVGIAAFYVLLRSKGNFSLLLLWMYLMGMLLLKKQHFY